MTREEAKEYLKVIQAYINGGIVESRILGDSYDDWEVETDPEFNFFEYEYRISSTSTKYRPFENAEECLQEISKHPNGGFLLNKECENINRFDIIINISDYSIYIVDEELTFEEALNDFSFVDGTPFGIKR